MGSTTINLATRKNWKNSQGKEFKEEVSLTSWEVK